MKTDEAIERGLFEDYLHGRLGGPEREEFERLYFEDDECFARLQAFLDAHRELSAAPTPARQRPRGRLPVWALSAAAALGVAALGWAVLQRSSPPAATTGPTLTPSATPSATPAAAPGPILGEAAPPPYTPLELRGGSGTERAFREAMEPYRSGDWPEALARLAPLARRTPDDPAVRFFLGACYLLTEQHASAAAELATVNRLGPSPYIEEAHVYRARALAQMGDLESARDELEAAAAMGGDLEPLARELLARLDQALPRP